jgi:hypothetical protein
MDTEKLLRLLKENDKVWKNRIKAKFGRIEVYFPSLDDMIKMKKAAGRAIDLEDLKYLKKIKEKKLRIR